MKKLLKKVPVFRDLARFVYYGLLTPFKTFPGSEEYWKKRYDSGRSSGEGSYRRLAEFKAEVLNRFVKDNHIATVIEYGCGDGNQLKLAEYLSYIGFDVSSKAVSDCRSLFADDRSKTFKLMKEYSDEMAQLTLSLDVIYHLIEDDVFSSYMERLFGSSNRFVVIYSSNTDKQSRIQAPHIKHRWFSKWIQQRKPGWRLIQHIPNRYPYTGDDEKGSFADFYIYEKA